jgi:hypothetical protein
MARQITYQQYLELLGLLVLGARHNRALTEIKLATAALLGEDDPDWHVADALYTDTTAEVLLDRLGITVALQGGAGDHGDQQR